MTRQTKILARKLNRAPVAARNAPTGPWMVGAVTAVSLSTQSLTATIHGDVTAIPGIAFLDSYTPVVGDSVILMRSGPHLWAVGAVETAASPAPLAAVGPGSVTNIVSGGTNRTNTWPFHYSTSAVITATGGSGWSFTSAAPVVFNGCGSFHVTPGDTSNALGFATVIMANCSIASGHLTLGGAAYIPAGTGTGAGLIRLNITAIGW